MNLRTKHLAIQNSMWIAPLLVLLCLSSCSKERQTIVGNEWQVTSIKVHADSILQHLSSGSTYILSFENRRNYYAGLDVNYCSGKVRFMSKNTVDFETPACTKVCCDSDIARTTQNILERVNKYDVSGETLSFTGENGELVNLTKL